MFRSWYALLAILVSTFSNWAAEKPNLKLRAPSPVISVGEHSPHLTVNVSFVLVPVHVTTMLGRPVTELELKDFRLFDENIEHSIKTLTKEDSPISVGVLFDSSGSMRLKMKQAVAATNAFLKTASPADEHFLIEFGDRAKLAVPFSGDLTDLSTRIARVRPFGRTSMYDAIQLAITQMKSAKHKRRAIVIFSDGADNHSRRNLQEIRHLLMEADVQVYAIGIFDNTDINGPLVLDELAEITGGTHLRADLSDLTVVSERIGNELRSEYVIGYSPTTEVRNGKYHRVKVIVTPKQAMPDLHISHRQGYYGSSN